MTKKYYLDSCIWRDYFEDRKDKFRPLGEWAFMIIKKIIDEGGVFVISDHLINELSNEYSDNQLIKLFELIPETSIQKIVTKREQSDNAFKIKNIFHISFPDALHAVLARDNNALLITRDKHFLELNGFVIIAKPEDLI